MSDLDGKAAWVTGACGGIGAAVVADMARAGAKVLATDVGDASTNKEAPAAVRYARCDTTQPDDVTRAAARCRDELGGLDVLVTCAAVLSSQDVLDITLEDWDAILATNLTGTFLSAQAAARQMVAAGRGGCIITLGSGGSERPRGNHASYAASKGGVRSLTFALSTALAPHGIRVVGLTPGTVETGLNAPRWRNPNARDEAEMGIPLGRLGRPEEVAAFATFLASDRAGYATGTIFTVDGGRGVRP